MIAFANYEASKLNIDHPIFLSFAILFVIILIALLTPRRHEKPTCILDAAQTTQIRGLSILLVIVGHFWVHACQIPPIYPVASSSVTAFLILSGFGLSISFEKNGLRGFLTARIKRVFLPYWIATCLWIFMDWYFLGRTYQPRDIVLTFLGCNLTQALRHIDFVRWFVSLLLLWYFLFYVVHYLFDAARSVIVLLIFGLLLSIAALYFRVFPESSQHQLFAFPIGCFLAACISQVRAYLERPINRYMVFFASISLVIFIQYVIVNFDSSSRFGYRAVNFVLMNLNPYFFFVFIALSVSIGNYYSTFLFLTGTFSYELFLLHGPFLVKYNPVFPFFEKTQLVFAFIAFVFLLLFVSYLLSLSTKRLSMFIVR